jgi:hypothetical protein
MLDDPIPGLIRVGGGLGRGQLGYGESQRRRPVAWNRPFWPESGMRTRFICPGCRAAWTPFLTIAADRRHGVRPRKCAASHISSILHSFLSDLWWFACTESMKRRRVVGIIGANRVFRPEGRDAVRPDAGRLPQERPWPGGRGRTVAGGRTMAGGPAEQPWGGALGVGN